MFAIIEYNDYRKEVEIIVKGITSTVEEATKIAHSMALERARANSNPGIRSSLGLELALPQQPPYTSIILERGPDDQDHDYVWVRDVIVEFQEKGDEVFFAVVAVPMLTGNK